MLFAVLFIPCLIWVFIDQRIKRNLWDNRPGDKLRIFKRQYSSYREFNRRRNVMFYVNLFDSKVMAQVKNQEQKRLLIKLKINTALVLANLLILVAAIDIYRAYGS